jgi:hypothetical protein
MSLVQPIASNPLSTSPGHSKLHRVVAVDSGAPDLSLQVLPTGEVLTSTGLILPKTSGAGIKVDNNVPTFGWKDLLGDIVVRQGHSSAPTYAAYGSGGLYQYQLSSSNYVFNTFHIPHDWVPGTDIFIHAHWSHATAVTGDVTWQFNASYAKGYNQGAFNANSLVTVSILEAAPNVAFQHMISEIQLSTSGQINSTDIEVDGLIFVKTLISANTTGDDPFLHFVDIHYQSTQSATKQKNGPAFYT